MFTLGFVWGMVAGSAITQIIIYVAVKRHRNNLEVTKPAHNIHCSQFGASHIVGRAKKQKGGLSWVKLQK